MKRDSTDDCVLNLNIETDEKEGEKDIQSESSDSEPEDLKMPALTDKKAFVSAVQYNLAQRFRKGMDVKQVPKLAEIIEPVLLEDSVGWTECLKETIETQQHENTDLIDMFGASFQRGTMPGI